MKKYTLFLLFLTLTLVVFSQSRMEMLPFGDFENWAVRYIHESSILGGKTRTLYAIAAKDTIDGNKAFIYGVDGNPWSVSNAYAKVSGIVKGSGTTYPELREKGNYCCRMDSKLEEVVALGFINIRVLVSGSIFTGKTIEPITTAKDPYQNIDFGVPFTGHPTALVFDYKCIISPEQKVLLAKGFGKPKQIDGHDEAQAYIYLQKRWEDKEGNIYARRIGTGCHRFTTTQAEWVNDFEVPIHYGDICKEPFFKDYMGFDTNNRAMNSKGKIVPIREIGWGKPGEEPTHIIIFISSGSYEAFIGYDGNTFWVDNVRLKYND